MQLGKTEIALAMRIQQFLKDGFKPHFDQLKTNFKSHPIWNQLRRLNSLLWLDTGSIQDSQQRWTHEFSALTTNNTLLNKEIQTGQYDFLISKSADILTSFPNLTEKQRVLEIAFILNAWHGLRLVEKFDAHVSVEEHTDLANNVELGVDYAKRYYAVCPQRFIIKIPFTPASLLVTRKLSMEGIPVNHTLGFSARHNYLIARIAKPAYVNVFLGRLNSFVADNKLGDGSYIGEKATLASQAAVRKLRQAKLSPSLQIGASFRSGKQVWNLAGIDVMTIPPKVADEFLTLGLSPQAIVDQTKMNYTIGLNPEINPNSIRLNTLWDIDEKFIACVNALEKENLDGFTPDDLIGFFNNHKCPDVLVRWSDLQIATSTKEGKIPKLENWKDALADRSIGLDSLMNLAGLNSFVADQKAMDERVREVLARSK
jgi:transaldolase